MFRRDPIDLPDAPSANLCKGVIDFRRAPNYTLMPKLRNPPKPLEKETYA
jgi:hypothetical protein